MTGKKKGFILTVFLFFVFVCIMVFVPALRAKASDLVEETVNATGNLYDKYALSDYGLDFYVDTSGGWLPWNWGENVGKHIYTALYEFTNVLWGMVLVFSYFTGYLVEQAYSLDFISDTVSYVSANIQKIAGVNAGGFTSHGLLASFLPILIIIMGAYFLYVAVVKMQTTKAVSMLLRFVTMAVIGIGVIAYSGSYLNMVNEFQKDFNREVLAISDTLTVGDTNSGVVGIRDNLFDIMVYEPYLLLQYGTTDIDTIGEDRIDELLGKTWGSEERENVVKEEVSDRNNEHMGLLKVGSRLGSVLLIFILDLIIAFCNFIFSGMMILSQIMFILFVSFVPVAFVFAMFPNSFGNLTEILKKCFEVLVQKAGITLILSVVFGLSSMCYALTGTHNFLWTMFLQIVLFVGALLKSNELLGFMKIRGNGEERSLKRGARRLGSLVRTVFLGKLLLGSSGGSVEGALETKKVTKGGRVPRRREPSSFPKGEKQSGKNGYVSETGTVAGEFSSLPEKPDKKTKQKHLKRDFLKSGNVQTVSGRKSSVPDRERDNNLSVPVRAKRQYDGRSEENTGGVTRDYYNDFFDNKQEKQSVSFKRKATTYRTGKVVAPRQNRLGDLKND